MEQLSKAWLRFTTIMYSMLFNVPYSVGGLQYNGLLGLGVAKP